MNLNKNIIENSYYRVRIILTFSAATILILVIISMVSYNYTRSLYLNQLSEQVNVVAKMLSEQIDGKYLHVLFGLPTNLVIIISGKYLIGIRTKVCIPKFLFSIKIWTLLYIPIQTLSPAF